MSLTTLKGDRSVAIQGALTEEIGKDVSITCKGETYHLDAEFGELLFTANTYAEEAGGVRNR